jgi:hypothetical protein
MSGGSRRSPFDAVVDLTQYVADEADAESLLDRLFRRVRFDESGCWLWQGAISSGYGQIGVGRLHHGNKRTVLVHRMAWTALVGPIPPDLVLDHLCRTRHCCNPDHLELVTLAENKARGESLLAKNARKTHCKWGHEFTPENTVLVRRPGKPDGRHCRACRWLRRRGLHARQVAA